MKQAVDEAVEPLLEARSGIGLAVGIVHGGERRVFSYGTLGRTRAEPVDGRTIFEIGSVTKSFTAVLLALTVEQDLMRCDDPVCNLLPELANLPRTITPLRLATHTSGLPRLPFQFFIRSWIKSPSNPYAGYTTTDLLAYLACYGSQFDGEAAKDGSFRYSNLGFGLLGYILARKLDMPYEEAVTNQICDPLDMRDTRVTLAAGQRERLALPHGSWGGSTSQWDMAALAGAGALRSTAHDMLTFIAANLGRGPARLVRALSSCHEMRSELADAQRRDRGAIGKWLKSRMLGNIPDPYGAGAGWHLSRPEPGSDTVHWHNGDTGGYRAFAGFVKARDVGVVLLSNRGPGTFDLLSRAPSVTEVGLTLLERLRHAADEAGSMRRGSGTAR